MYKKSPYDIVLSDITMPNMNGVKLSREIRHLNSEQTIIILSAHSELEYLIELIDIGIHQFIAKPFNEDELFYRLLKVSENIVYKQHYLNTLLKSQKINSESLDEEIEEYLIENDLNEEAESFDVDLDLNEKKDTTLVFENVVEHEVMDSNNFYNNLKNDTLVWDALEGQVENLLDLSSDFNDLVERIYLNKIDEELLLNISSILKGMYSTFSFIDTFKNLGEVLNDLAIFLEDLNLDNLNESQIEKIKIIEFIYDDISRFIETVFVYKDTLDVHYLEDSLRSSVQQLKTNVLSTDIEEDELELF